jgi:hypothetical protein
VVATGDLDEVAAFLDSHEGPSERLHRTLEAAFYDGYPRARNAGPPPPAEHGPPLSYLVGMAERFTIAHEYAHGRAPAAGPGAGPTERRAEEHLADHVGMFWTVHSALKFDDIQPVFALGGALFTLGCLDVRRRALSVLLTGDEYLLPAESHTHPAPEARSEQILEKFDEHFRIDEAAGTAEASLVPLSGGDYLSPVRRQQAKAYSRILEMIWERVLPRLEESHRSGRPLHPMWQ